MNATRPTPRRGRPLSSNDSRDQLRRQILDGAARAYGRLGWHAVTIEEIIVEAGISRPTYYRVFRDKHEAVQAVVADANADLLMALARAISSPGSPEARIRAAVNAYFDWGCAAGAVARVIYREMHLPDGPAAEERRRTLERIGQLLLQHAGRSQMRQQLLDSAVLHAVEHLGSCVFAQPEEGALRESCLDCALRLVQCALLDRDSNKTSPKSPPRTRQ